MRYLIDALAVVGLICASFGVFLEFGLGFSLIFGGLAVAWLGFHAARLVNASSDEGSQ